jgi:DNA-binding NarL/FixJ family response regulator
MATRVLVVDDHAVVRRGIRQLLDETTDIITSDEASNTAEAVAKVREGDFDVVVLDISMPGRSGLEALREIKKLEPGLPVLVLSMHSEDQYAIRVLKAGASGYVTKGGVPDDLVSAIRKVLKGGTFMSASVAAKMALPVGAHECDHLHEKLSEREYQIMIMIASGELLADIGPVLNVSPKTVSSYRRRILDKMQMTSNKDIIQYVRERNLTL